MSELTDWIDDELHPYINYADYLRLREDVDELEAKLAEAQERVKELNQRYLESSKVAADLDDARAEIDRLKQWQKRAITEKPELPFLLAKSFSPDGKME